MRAYTLKDQQGNLHHAYVVVWRQNAIGGYYDFEGIDWLNPPLFAHARVAEHRRAHLPDWSTTARTSTSSAGARGNVLYWLTNTLLEELSNAQMIALAKSAQPLH